MHSLVCSCILVLAILPALSRAGCPSQETIAAYLADFAAARPTRGFGPHLTMDEAECARARLIKALPKVAGPVIGYKAAFMSPEVQKRFGLSDPAWGVMYRSMMLESGATLSPKFGAIPLYEADFVVVVKDAKLADARTPLEALQHISAVVPFIELLDVMLEGTPKGVEFIATNSGFRGGVLGPRIDVDPDQAFLDRLADMTIVMSEERSGQELGRAHGTAMNGNPIYAAMWLAKALDDAGLAPKPGELLSLGRFLPPAPPKPGTTIAVKYIGLPGNPSVNVHFE